MGNATRIANCLLLTACLVGISTIAESADPPAAATQESAQQPVRKPNFYLSESEIRRLLRGQRVVPESPDAARIASDWRAGRESISIRKPATPILQPRPNRRVQLGVNDPDTLNCGHGSDLMSSFERADRCRGIGVLIPSIWEPRERRAP